MVCLHASIKAGTLTLLTFFLGVSSAIKVSPQRRSKQEPAPALLALQSESGIDEDWPSWLKVPTKRNVSGRAAYMEGKLRIDLDLAGKFAELPPPAKTSSVAGTKKVAFLFMLMKDIDWPQIWDRFFSEARREEYSIYLHRALVLKNNMHPPPLPLAEHGAKAIPWVETEWCGLMGVELALLSAAMEDVNNQQFVFVSQDAVPLKDFRYVYHNLIQTTPERSKFCFASKAKYVYAVHEQLYNEMNQGCSYKDFYNALDIHTMKHHQWIVLARRHAVTVIRHATEALHVWNESWRGAALDLGEFGEGCSDEAIPATALLTNAKHDGKTTNDPWADLNRLGVDEHCLTYVQWHNCFMDSEFELPPSDRLNFAKDLSLAWTNSGELLKFLWYRRFDAAQSVLKHELNDFPHAYELVQESYLNNMVNQSFMFARKFKKGSESIASNGTRTPLQVALPRLWKALDQKVASKKIWTRMESSGRPQDIV